MKNSNFINSIFDSTILTFNKINQLFTFTNKTLLLKKLCI